LAHSNKKPRQGYKLPPKIKEKPKTKHTDFAKWRNQMKKVTLLALIAIMLIGMLAFAACKAKEEAVPADSVMVEEATDTEAVDDTLVDKVEGAADAVKDAAAAVK